MMRAVGLPTWVPGWSMAWCAHSLVPQSHHGARNAAGRRRAESVRPAAVGLDVHHLVPAHREEGPAAPPRAMPTDPSRGTPAHARSLARTTTAALIACKSAAHSPSVWRERAQLGAARRGSRPRRARPDASTRRVVEYDVNRAGPPANDLLLGRAREDREEVLRGRFASPC